jgi:cell division protease FtsH
VAELLEHTDQVHKISIIPRGIAALGYTMQLPTEDRYLMTKRELLDRLCVLLGGRVAEEIIFGEISTGAHNDLYKATDIAKSMVKQYGMSDRLGYITFEGERKPLFLDINPMAGQRDYSEATAREIDKEVKKIIDESYTRTKMILSEKKDLLEKISKTLLEKETIDGEELRAIIRGYEDESRAEKFREKTD